MKNFFYIEVTDTFAGEANYGWVTRHKVRASTPRGAMVRLGRMSGLSWRKVGDYGDTLRYDSARGAMCAFIESWDEVEHDDLPHVRELL